MDLDNWNTWKQFLEELADPQFVDTSSLISKKTLSHELWEKNILKPDVLNTALRIAHDFFNNLNLDNIQIKDIILTGSLASYNWSELSDFDLHILLDFNKLKNRELIQDYFKEKIRNWNRTHSILIKGYEVELYIQDSNEPHVSTGVYSLMENRWLKQSVSYRLDINYELVKEKAAKLMEEIDDTYDLYAEKDYLLAKETADSLMEKIKRYRKAGLETGGVYSIENLVFKVLRRNDYLKKLSSIKTLAYDASMSLNERDKKYISYEK
jgi:predicted nucleotidyltransferase